MGAHLTAEREVEAEQGAFMKSGASRSLAKRLVGRPCDGRPAWQREVKGWSRVRQQEYGWRWKELEAKGLHSKAAQYLAWDEIKDGEKR